MKKFICIACPKSCHLQVDEDNGYKVTGNSCKKGEVYGKSEATCPVRMLTSTVILKGGSMRRCPVKTAEAIPKDKVGAAMDKINQIVLHEPVKVGEVALENLLDTGVDVVVTSNM